MKNIVIAFLLLITVSTSAQDICSGVIIENENKKALSYVNIGIVGENIGTVSNLNGEFLWKFG